MKILEITGEPILHGGQENFIYNILSGMNNPDFQIDVLTPYYCDNEHFKALIAQKRGSVYELKLEFRPQKSRRLLRKPVLAFLKGRDYDVIHIHSGSISVLAYEAQAAKKAGIPKIIVHSHSTGGKSLKHAVIHTAFSHLLNSCPTDYLACSKEAGEMKFPKRVQNKVGVVKNGIMLRQFRENRIVRENLRRAYGIPDDAFVIGHVARFTSEKNHAFLLDVFSKVYASVPGSYLMLVGEGDLKIEMEKKAAALGLDQHVVFTGVVDNPQDYYNIFDFFVLPSLYEGFSFVTLEAQANGLPCLISTGVPEAVCLTDQVTRMDLNSDQWSAYLTEHKKEKRSDNQQILLEKGYDISVSADLIERLYLK